MPALRLRRKILFSAGLVLSAGLGLAVLGELGLRIVAAAERPWALSAHQVPPSPEADTAARSRIPGLGYVYTKANADFARGRINSWGYPDTEFEAGRSDGFRIAMVGDSVTYGTGVADVADLFASLVERDLDARAPPGRRVEVVNLAIEGYSLLQIYATVRHIALPLLEPDLIVYVHSTNDVVDTSIEDFLYMTDYPWGCLSNPVLDPVRRPAPSAASRARFAIQRESALYAELRHRLTVFRYDFVLGSLDTLAERWAGTPRGDRLERLRERHSYLRPYTPSCADYDFGWNALDALFELAATSGVPLTIVAPPVFEHLDRDGDIDGTGFFDWFLESHPAVPIYFPTEDLRTALADGGLASDSICISELDCHPNELGHRILASGIARFLRDVPAVRRALVDPTTPDRLANGRS